MELEDTLTLASRTTKPFFSIILTKATLPTVTKMSCILCGIRQDVIIINY